MKRCRTTPFITAIFAFAMLSAATNASAGVFVGPSQVTPQASNPDFDASNTIADLANNIMPNEFIENVDGGPTDAETLKSEIDEQAGDVDPLDWNHLDLTNEFGDNQYELSTVVTDVKDPSNNVEVLFTHTLPLKDQNQLENTDIEYTTTINDAEERTLAANLVVSKAFNAKDGFSPASEAIYSFGLAQQPVEPTFDLRAPVGVGQLAAVKSGDLIPFESVDASGTPTAGQDVTIKAREPDLDTLTFKVKIKQADSPLQTTMVLIYQKI